MTRIPSQFIAKSNLLHATLQAVPIPHRISFSTNQSIGATVSPDARFGDRPRLQLQLHEDGAPHRQSEQPVRLLLAPDDARKEGADGPRGAGAHRERERVVVYVA